MALTDIQKRWILFLGGCITVRSLFAYIAKTVNPKWLPYLGALALLPVLGWLYILFVKQRTTGPEVFGGRIWWNWLRPIHIILYTLFALYAFNQNGNAYLFLVVDVLIGLAAFLHQHAM
jgi:hypothetical protein